ncbi:hypothetical protein [Pontibacillus sp. HMF3514]|uniref:hypothetical protein n=1 Tax=Pontibacillus sp. HMF3514 TaxID=2692425 RepID=UPI00131FDF7F|nr:hypothetical protein [Pontibacillus sp. HMF3514]QHE53381.1 hypothetical protein GS400_15755 [Pontibacillus sp. HMF3514]
MVINGTVAILRRGSRTFIPLFTSNHLEKAHFVTNKVLYVRDDSRNALKDQNKGTDVRKV